MAHKGRFYPIAFRRDWNLNLNDNNFGWANRYIVVWHDLGTGLGAFWNFSTWDCGPGIVGPTNRQTWTSDHVLKFGAHFFVEVRVSINPDSSFSDTLRMSTEEDGDILVYQVQEAHTHFINFPPTLAGTLISYDPAWFDLPPTPWVLAADIRPKLWTEGPPH